jgi:hypothetical protein
MDGSQITWSKDNALNSYNVFEEDGTTPAIGTDYNGITKITVDFDGVKCSIVSLDKIVEDIEARVTVNEGNISTNTANIATNTIQRAILGGGELINSTFPINQREVSGTVVLSAGEYGHDRWRAGSGGCTYTFATSLNVTTITISAGTLEQEIEGVNLQSDDYILHWSGTAQGQIDVGGFAVSPVTETLVGGVNSIVEFGTGTLIIPKLEQGLIATNFISNTLDEELRDCLRYFEVKSAKDTSGGITTFASGVVFSTSDSLLNIAYYEKRIIPTITYISKALFQMFTGNSTEFLNVASGEVTNAGLKTAELQLRVINATLTVGDGAVLRSSNVACAIEINAELP